MKHSLVILIVIALAFVSCDQRGSTREKLQNSIAEFSKKQTVIETATYFPERYTEVKTDSLIANTFKVSIKNYSLMDSEILVSQTRSQHEKISNYHREFVSDIKVFHHSKSIFNTTLSAVQFKDNFDQTFWNTATLEHVWVNQEQSNTKTLHLNIAFKNIKQQTHKIYELVLNTEGKQQLHLIEEIQS